MNELRHPNAQKKKNKYLGLNTSVQQSFNCTIISLICSITLPMSLGILKYKYQKLCDCNGQGIDKTFPRFILDSWLLHVTATPNVISI